MAKKVEAPEAPEVTQEEEAALLVGDAAEAPAAEEPKDEPEAEAPAEPFTYRLGEYVNGFLVTSQGLPNTCSVTGLPITEGFWLARNDDEARAGLGISVAALENPA